MNGRKRGSGEIIQWLLFTLILCAVTAVWFIFYTAAPEVHDSGEATDGVLDIRSYDTDRQVVRITSEWEFYPDRLYTPEDFAEGKTAAPVKRIETEHPDSVRFGTYHLTLMTVPDSYAVMAGYSIDYGTDIYVNGNRVRSVGTVSSDPSKAVPCVNYVTFPVHADGSGKIELVVRYSNFVHNEGGAIHNFVYTSPAMMDEYRSRIFLPVNIIAGALLFAAVCCLLKGCIQKDMNLFLLAACCVSFAFRDQRFYVAELLPENYNWLLYYRIYILIVCYMPASVLLLFMNIFRKAKGRWLMIITAAAGAAVGIMMFAYPTQDAVRIMYGYIFVNAAVAVCFAVLLTVYFVRVQRPEKTDILALCALGVLLSGMSAEVILGRRVPAVTRGGFTPAAMTAFVMLMLLTLSMKEMQTREELLESRRREEELKQLNAVNKEFTRIVAHEINTPLTVASGYAQMLSRQLRRGEENPEMADTLDTISSETRRLSALVAQMLRMSRNAQIQPLRERVNVQTLLSDAAAIAKPVLQKNENFLEIDCRECGDIAANRDAMLQIFMNLADNAGRHTRNGRIKLSAESDGSNVIFRVSDTGSGISRENRDKVFDQGYSPDGRSGIGLAVCRDLVTAYGGVMEIESTGPDGTVFMFTLPLWKEN